MFKKKLTREMVEKRIGQLKEVVARRTCSCEDSAGIEKCLTCRFERLIKEMQEWLDRCK